MSFSITSRLIISINYSQKYSTLLFLCLLLYFQRGPFRFDKGDAIVWRLKAGVLCKGVCIIGVDNKLGLLWAKRKHN